MHGALTTTIVLNPLAELFFHQLGANEEVTDEKFKSIRYLLEQVTPIAKRTKSKNRMQTSEFPTRLSQHKLVLRKIQGM